jgi:hypothetical protein
MADGLDDLAKWQCEIQEAKVIVTMLVLAAVVLAILGIVVSLMPPRPVSGVDESSIHTAEQLDAAMAIQQSMRIAELQRRMANRITGRTDYLAWRS